MGDSDNELDAGEDAGEELFDLMGVDVNEIKKRKEIGRLHRFRERIQ